MSFLTETQEHEEGFFRTLRQTLGLTDMNMTADRLIQDDVCACYYIEGGREIFANCSGRALLRDIPEFTAIEMDCLSTIDRPLAERQTLHDVRIPCDRGRRIVF